MKANQRTIHSKDKYHTFYFKSTNHTNHNMYCYSMRVHKSDIQCITLNRNHLTHYWLPP